MDTFIAIFPAIRVQLGISYSSKRYHNAILYNCIKFRIRLKQRADQLKDVLLWRVDMLLRMQQPSGELDRSQV